MKVAIIAVGSQGDVQPLAALGVGLLRIGHAVKLVTHAAFEELACGLGLDFAPLAGNPLEIVQGEVGQEWVASGASSLLFLRRFGRVAAEMIDAITHGALEAARGSDAVVYGLPLVPIGFTVAELLGVPGIPTSLYPVHPTGEFPPVLATRLRPRCAPVNRLSEVLIVAVYTSLVRRLHGAWRRRQGLERLPNLLAHFEHAAVPYLYGYSPSAIPTPADWKGRGTVCGYWFPPSREGWRSPARLEEFLAAGEPPVYVGFGSMPNGDAPAVTAIVAEALRRTGRRGILSLGWGGLKDQGLPDTILPVTGFVPHEWLFPRVSLVVHHGGAGTTAMAFRIGVPQVVIPFFADQFFWAQTVHRLGVGSRPLFRRRLSVDRLEGAIREALGVSEVADRARMLARQIQAEDGVAAGAAAIDAYLRNTTRRTSR